MRVVAALVGIGLACSLATGVAWAQGRTAMTTRLPVREVTVFKDGHAFVTQEGKATVENDGRVTLRDLPNPVLGTFWPYASEKGVKVQSVTAARQRVSEDRDARTTEDFLRANIGAKVRIERPGTAQAPIEGTVVSVQPGNEPPDPEPVFAPPPPGSYSPYYVAPNGATPAPVEATVVLRTEQGLLPLPISHIPYVTLLGGDGKTRLMETHFRNELTLQLDGASAGKTATIGLMYLQKGLRWIPQYKITLDGKGGAHVQMSATIINELADLEDTQVNLVIGIPTFAFKDQPDPMGLQDTIARLSRYFAADSPTGNNLSNAVMGQAAGAGYGGFRAESRDGGQTAPVVSASEANEEFYLFTVRHVSLKRGQRMAMPVTEFDVTYKNVYTLDLMPGLTREMIYTYNYDQNAAAELAKALAEPKAVHQIRLCNTSQYPLTTAPALLVSGGRVLSQGLLGYTAVGAESDLPLSGAVNIGIKRTDKETKRTPNYMRIAGYDFSRVDLTGTIGLTNYGKEPVTLEVTRYVFGDMLKADHDGQVDSLDLLSTIDTLYPRGVRYVIPSDMSRYNGLGRAVWKITLPPNQPTVLSYDWDYLVR